MTNLSLLLLIVFLIAGPASAGDDRHRYIRENRLLEAELMLARKPDIYLVFNLKEKTVCIKTRGIPLREMKISDFSLWGSPVSSNAYRLKKKWTFFKPGRGEIEPGAAKSNDDFKLDALELANMPSRYALFVEDGTKISVIPLKEGVVSGMSNVLYASMRFFIRPASMLWYRLQGKPYTAIDIVMEKNDAQALYWSFAEGSGAIIYPP